MITPPNFAKDYVIEDFISDLELFLKANYNVFIAKMNTDKPNLTLKTVDDGAYFFQTMNETQVNHDPFFFYGERPPDTDSANTATSKNYTVDVAVIMAIGNEDSYNVGIKLLRYRQALESLFELGFNSIDKRVKLEVTSMSPFPFELTNSSAPYAGIGVSLDVPLS